MQRKEVQCLVRMQNSKKKTYKFKTSNALLLKHKPQLLFSILDKYWV